MTTSTLPASQTTIPRAERPCCHDVGTYDADVQRLRDLIGQGIEQPAASRIIWAGDPAPTDPALVAGWVRRQLVGRLPWLRLESGEVGPGAVWLGCLALTVFVVALAVVGR